MTLSLTLPDGRTVALDGGVAGLLRSGVLVAESVQVGVSEELTAETARWSDRLRSEHAGKAPAEIGGLGEARRLYRSLGTDPTRTRPSSEALLRRVLKGNPLYVINNAVDACNLASLCFLLPIGLYDLERIEGDIILRLGKLGEEYDGIRKAKVHLEARLGLFDASGPFGSPTRDSASFIKRRVAPM